MQPMQQTGMLILNLEVSNQILLIGSIPARIVAGKFGEVVGWGEVFRSAPTGFRNVPGFQLELAGTEWN